MYFINKFKVAFLGIFHAYKIDRSVRIQFVLALITLFVGFLIKLTYVEWLIVILCIGLVITTELINTAIEKLCNIVVHNDDEKLGYVKDISAGAVLCISIISAIIMAIILINKLGG